MPRRIGIRVGIEVKREVRMDRNRGNIGKSEKEREEKTIRITDI